MLDYRKYSIKDLNKILRGFKVFISSDFQSSSVEEFKIEQVLLRSLIWIPQAGSKEKTNSWLYNQFYLICLVRGFDHTEYFSLK